MRKKAIKTLGDFFGVIRPDDFKSWSRFKESDAAGWIGFFLLALIASLLLNVSFGTIPQNIEVGMIASRDIKAGRSYEIIDEAATEKFRREALQSVLAVFDFDEGITGELNQKLEKAFAEVENQYKTFFPNKEGVKWADLSIEQQPVVKQGFETQLNVMLSKSEWRALTQTEFTQSAKIAISRLIEEVQTKPIIADHKPLSEYQDRGVLLRRIRAFEGTPQNEIEQHVKEFKNVLSEKAAKQSINEVDLTIVLGENLKIASQMLSIAKKMISPNVNYNSQESEQRREAAVRNVKNVTFRIQPGEVIIRGGARYEPRHIEVLEGMRKDLQKGKLPLRFVGTFLFLMLVFGTTFYFSERFVKRFAPERRDYLFIGFILIFMLIALKISLSVSSALHDTYLYNIPRNALFYSIPFAAGAMLIRIYLSAEVALVFAVLFSIITGIAVGTDINLAAFCLVSSIAGSATVSKVDHRAAIVRAGFITGLVNAAMVLGMLLLEANTVSRSLGWMVITSSMLSAFTGGMFATILLFISMYLIEALFEYTSDIKLLELANLNHPLLRELIVRAPGTYHHSHIIGIVGEAAAEAIEANPLLVRVGAYYHDIGKIRKPNYYIENVRDGVSPHEQLSPHMSALVVQAHVKEGIQMAKAHRLPPSIIDMVPQHHGTKQISFFYQKAKQINDPEMQAIEEKDFRYPGPKPQTREAGILMLADASEATVRALKEKSPQRIQQTVDNIISQTFTESQLDECDLTLRDLNEIRNAFVRTFLGIYHQRVEYPEEKKEGEVISNEKKGEAKENQSSSAASSSESRSKETKAVGETNIRRLRFPDQ